MITIDANEVVVSFWAIGPVFRNALKKNIEKYIQRFPVPFKFTILTDHVEDFEYIRELTDRCVAILDIDAQRKNYDWSFELEVIPTAKTDREYTAQFRENLRQLKRFSYSLHRFVIPWMAENKVTKFIMLDPDVHIQVKNPDIKTIQDYTDAFLVKNTLPHKPPFTEESNYVMGSAYWEADTELNTYMFGKLNELMGTDKTKPQSFGTNDGPFRFYNFKSVEDVSMFFNTWNVGVQAALTNYEFHTAHGSIFLNDEMLLGTLYAWLGMEVCPIDHTAVTIRHRIENRYTMPSMGYYKLADTFEEFLEINKEELVQFYRDCNWPEVIEELYGEQ
jgi:hypothetical protein